MLNLENGIDSLTNFKRQTSEYLDRLHKTGEPVVLTVNGKAEIVIQDAAAYQRLVEELTQAHRDQLVTEIKKGLADVRAGRTQPDHTALAALAQKQGRSTSARKRPLAEVVKEAQALFMSVAPPDRILSEELIQERRAEAARE